MPHLLRSRNAFLTKPFATLSQRLLPCTGLAGNRAEMEGSVDGRFQDRNLRWCHPSGRIPECIKRKHFPLPKGTHSPHLSLKCGPGEEILPLLTDFGPKRASHTYLESMILFPWTLEPEAALPERAAEKKPRKRGHEHFQRTRERTNGTDA
jgi:hypothetical protein